MNDSHTEVPCKKGFPNSNRLIPARLSYMPNSLNIYRKMNLSYGLHIVWNS